MDAPRLVVNLSEADLESIIERAVSRALIEKRQLKREHLTAREAAQALRCSDRQVRRLIAVGRLARAKLGNGGSSRVLIPRSSVEELLAQSTQ